MPRERLSPVAPSGPLPPLARALHLNPTLVRLDFSREQSGCHGMPARAPLSDLESAILDALTDRLENALDLTVIASAVDNLEQIASLCTDAADIARAGRLLLRGGG